MSVISFGRFGLLTTSCSIANAELKLRYHGVPEYGLILALRDNDRAVVEHFSKRVSGKVALYFRWIENKLILCF
jgi:hypothetical protein